MVKHHEFVSGTLCSCMPLRTGVYWHVALVLATSTLCLSTLITEDLRVLAGGYAGWTGTAVLLLGLAGAFYGFCAFVGLRDNESAWVHSFAAFSAVRVAAIAAIFVGDLLAFRDCGHLAANGALYVVVNAMSGHHHGALEHVAMMDLCDHTRLIYIVATVTNLVLSTYLVCETFRWCHIIEHGPVYHIALGETEPLKIHTGYQYPPLPHDYHAQIGVSPRSAVPPPVAFPPPSPRGGAGTTMSPMASRGYGAGDQWAGMPRAAGSGPITMEA
mmetsp:Transcript_82022/g.230101  ORF Transcript_82022/g.230101 Transcript_82022/m.230101 type:complete len:272 (+) Transcript_82022:70-885(+)